MVAGLAAVVGDKNAAVGAGDDPLGVLRIDPDGSEIAERPAEWPRLRPSTASPCLAAVFGTAQIRAGDEEPVGIVLINAELIERVAGLAAHVAAVRAHFAPGHARVVGAIDLAAHRAFAHRGAAFARLPNLFFGPGALVAVVNERIERLRVFLIEVYSDAPDLAVGKTAFQPLPIRAAVGGFVYARARASVLQPPRMA